MGPWKRLDKALRTGAQLRCHVHHVRLACWSGERHLTPLSKEQHRQRRWIGAENEPHIP
jgi:hypothetical protein